MNDFYHSSIQEMITHILCVRCCIRCSSWSFLVSLVFYLGWTPVVQNHYPWFTTLSLIYSGTTVGFLQCVAIIDTCSCFLIHMTVYTKGVELLSQMVYKCSNPQYQIILQSSWTHLYPYRQRIRNPVDLHLRQHLVLLHCLIFSSLLCVKWYLMVVLCS